MIIDKNEYIKIQDEVKKYSDGIASADELDSFAKHISAKLADFNPSIMIYGTYNAGKSTLLNALFGKEEMAKTGDSPETAEVHGYEYNGVVIYDTPGINAPIEHEDVTKEHLDKCEIILFVMSNDGSLEEEYIYNKISEIVKANKPIIIVLNNKRGTELNSNEAIEEINKVNINLSKIGDKHGIDKIENKVGLCMINARTALKGKVENKSLLLKGSNIGQLEVMLDDILVQSGSSEVINALNNYIQKFVNNVIERTDNKIDIKELQKIEELITYLEKSKQSSDIKLKNIVSKQMPILTDELSSSILEGTTKNNINSLIEEYYRKITQQIETEVHNIESNLKTKIDDFCIEIKNLNPEYADLGETEQHKESNEPSTLDGLASKALEKLKDQNVIKEGVEQTLKMAKKHLPNLMKGKGKTWIKKAAGKATVAVTAVISAYEVYSASKEHIDAVRKERDRVLGAKNQAQLFADDTQTVFFDSINEIIADIFDALIIDYRGISKKLDGENSALIMNKNALLGICNRL